MPEIHFSYFEMFNLFFHGTTGASDQVGNVEVHDVDMNSITAGIREIVHSMVHQLQWTNSSKLSGYDGTFQGNHAASYGPSKGPHPKALCDLKGKRHPTSHHHFRLLCFYFYLIWQYGH